MNWRGSSVCRIAVMVIPGTDCTICILMICIKENRRQGYHWKLLSRYYCSCILVQ